MQQAAGPALQWLRGLLAPDGDGAEASYAGLADLVSAVEPGSGPACLTPATQL